MVKPKCLFRAIFLIAFIFMPLQQTLAATFQGLKFHDLNGNGVKDADEESLANHTIFVKNNDMSSQQLKQLSKSSSTLKGTTK